MGRYFGGLAYTWQMSGIFGWLLLADWSVFPFAVHAVRCDAFRHPQGRQSLSFQSLQSPQVCPIQR